MRAILPTISSSTLPNYLLSLDLERVMGIEPTYSAWKAAALPLSYTRLTTKNHKTSERNFNTFLLF